MSGAIDELEANEDSWLEEAEEFGIMIPKIPKEEQKLKEGESFEDYVRQLETSKRELGYAWLTAIGLQALDGLKTSSYLEGIARMNIGDKITSREAEKLIEDHYNNQP